MKTKVKQILRTTLSIVLIVSILLPYGAYAASDAVKEYEPPKWMQSPVSAPAVEKNIQAEQVENEETRTVEELAELGYVKLDSNGLVVSVLTSEESGLDMEDAMELLAEGRKTMATYTAADRRDPSMVQLGISEEQIVQASKLHGSQSVFQGEIGALLRMRAAESMGEEHFQSLLTLICGGYTLGQAQAAVYAAEVMGYTLEELCTAKASEIELYQQSLPEEEEQEDPAIKRAAIKMGVPYMLVQAYLASHPISVETLLSEFQNRSDTEQNLYYESEGVSNTEGTNTVGDSSISYTPEQVLDNPFGYTEDGTNAINVGSGNHIYRECYSNLNHTSAAHTTPPVTGVLPLCTRLRRVRRNNPPWRSL